ncbi:MAG: hypothetical protein ACFFC7_32015, partial [Candidatus Hermodarchaeota archaeon]
MKKRMKKVNILLVISLSILLVCNSVFLSMDVSARPLSAEPVHTNTNEEKGQIHILVMDKTNPSVTLAVTTLQEALEDTQLSFSLTYIDDFDPLPIFSTSMFRPTDDLVIIGHGSPLGLRDPTQQLSWSAVQRILSHLRYRRMIFLACYSQRGIPQNLVAKTLGFKDLIDAEAGALFAATQLMKFNNVDHAQILSLMTLMREKQEELRHPLITLNGEDYPWLYGLNYPWGAGDVGPWYYWGNEWYWDEDEQNEQERGLARDAFEIRVEADFRIMATMGVHVVRWWLDSTGNDFIDLSDGYPFGYREDALDRLKWVLEYICPKYEIYLIPTLFSHNYLKLPTKDTDNDGEDDALNTNAHDYDLRVQWQGLFLNPVWEDFLIKEAGKLASFLPRQAYPYLLAWDLWNEPTGNIVGWGVEGAILKPSHDYLKDFLSRLAAEIDFYDSEVLITLGETEDPLNSAGYWDYDNIDFFSLHLYSNGGTLQDALSYNLKDSLGRDIPIMIGECGATDYGDEAKQTVAINGFLQNAYSQGYIGILPWSFGQGYAEELSWGFVPLGDGARDAANDSYWRPRAHVFRMFEDDHWDEVTITNNPVRIARTEFSETDYNWDEKTPRIWAWPTSYQFDEDNMLFNDVSYVDLYVNIPPALADEDEIWVTLVYTHRPEGQLGWSGVIEQKLSDGTYLQLNKFDWYEDAYDLADIDDKRWSKTFKLHTDYDDASPYGGTNVKLRIRPLNSVYVDFKLYGGQVLVVYHSDSDYDFVKDDVDPDTEAFNHVLQDEDNWDVSFSYSNYDPW